MTDRVIKPVGQTVILKLLKNKETSSPIILKEREKGQKEYLRAEVLASGKGSYLGGSRFVPNDVKEGDIVLVPKLAVRKLKISGGETMTYTLNIDIEAIIEE